MAGMLAMKKVPTHTLRSLATTLWIEGSLMDDMDQDVYAGRLEAHTIEGDYDIAINDLLDKSNGESYMVRLG
ncbi:predicted protein [Lichtheimia corymbifera JMRC:FSU:9682]|uniref:Uncharacterized protein n=1 Tax=Lichtheimia corymbifera JMRC:FSU:9682 TaxID=1263082 RepID=A0A068SEE6_9FUNG|nr:predicted protein [Lichtheimia corymbifera JMRC:FSU:9682]